MSNIFLPKKASKHQFPYEEMVLKESHEDSPIWINYDALIIFETFKCNSKQAADFLIAIAEPISRPKYIHEYQITAYSLYAAVSVGLSTDDIISTLSFFSKNVMPKSVKNFIIECTLSYDKIKLVIQFNKYFIEAVNKNILNMLCEDEIIRKNVNVIDLNATENVKSYEVLNVEVVKKRSIEIDYPLIEEYDFRNDKVLSSLNIDLKPTTIIRSYQETCLNKMFCNGRARSGIIVLPCGSGKTLVGITALTTIKKSCLILCTSAVSVEQWRQQTIFFTNISPDNIVRFTSDHKEWFKDKSGILVTTYTMLAYTGRRSYEAQKIMDSIQTTEWGLLLLDEVHVVPAQMFRKVISLVTHHCKLGLTATLVREDDKIEDLNFLIGPKLYEADWQDLSQQGHIAKVECSEVWCNMTSEFYREYLAQPSRKRRLLSIMNPTKFQVCEYLINRHEAKGDKIIVFSDSVAALKAYALRLGKPYIYGPTGQTERMRILKQFQTNPLINTIFLSKVGDTSIDLPEATCLIQISSHFGSRRQEAQRLGRILRAKRRNDPDFKVFFYSLVSKDTDEMFYSTKRQQFLVDQGYTFNIVTEISELLKNEERVYKTKGQQRELLASVLLASEKELESEDSNNQDEITSLKQDIRSMTGVGNMAYVETNNPSIAHKKKKKNN